MHSTPKILKAHNESYKIKKIMRDEELWLQGRYNLEAYIVALSHFGAGLTGKISHAEYFKKPFMQEIESNNSNTESKEQIAVFEMKKRTKALRKNGMSESPL